MASDKKVIFGSAIFSNMASAGEDGKIECRDIFTSFLAWAYPTSFRNWFATLTLYKTTDHAISVAVSIGTLRGNKTSLVTVDIMPTDKNLGNIITIPISYKFPREGLYYVYFNEVGTSNNLRIPLKVYSEKWPIFTKKEIDFIKSNPAIIPFIRTNVICSDCSQPYIFEEAILQDYKPAKSVHLFPRNGKFECESCGRTLHLKDIQGKIRSSVKKSIMASMKGVK